MFERHLNSAQMADKIEKDIQRFVQGVEQLVSRKLPIYAGKTAQQHFRENFTKGGFVDGGLHPWTPSKRLSSGGQGADSKYGTLLSSRKHLYSSINYTPSTAKVTIFNDVVYAQIHNEGGTIGITPKMRGYAWHRYYELAGKGKSGSDSPKIRKKGEQSAEAPESEEAKLWRGLALTKKQFVTIPKRQFIGQSAELDDKIAAYIEREVLKILNS